MNDICKDQEIPISNVSDLNWCYKELTYEENDIVNSMELYFNDNSTFVPLTFHWNQFMHPCNFVKVLTSGLNIYFSAWKVPFWTENIQSS